MACTRSIASPAALSAATSAGVLRIRSGDTTSDASRWPALGSALANWRTCSAHIRSLRRDELRAADLARDDPERVRRARPTGHVHVQLAGRGGLRRLQLKGGHDQERVAVGRHRQAGEPLQLLGVVAGHVAQVGPRGEQQDVDACHGDGLLHPGESLGRVEGGVGGHGAPVHCVVTTAPEAAERGAEPEGGPYLGQQLRVGRGGGQGAGAVEVIRQRDVGRGLDHRRGDVQVGPGRLELLAGAGGEAAVALVERALEALEVAEGADQGGGGLLADAGDAGQAVARVAPQHGEVGVPVAGNVVLFRDFGLGDRFEVAETADRVEDADFARVVDELEQVAVAGDDVDRLAGAGGQGGDDVVGLVAGRLGEGDPGRGEDLGDQRDLHDQAGRGLLGPVRLGAVRLVAGDRGDPERRPPVGVEAGDQASRAMLPDQPGDRVEEPPDRVHRGAVGRRHRLRHSVERPVVQRRRVKKHQRAQRLILPRPGTARVGYPGRWRRWLRSRRAPVAASGGLAARSAAAEAGSSGQQHPERDQQVEQARDAEHKREDHAQRGHRRVVVPADPDHQRAPGRPARRSRAGRWRASTGSWRTSRPAPAAGRRRRGVRLPPLALPAPARPRPRSRGRSRRPRPGRAASRQARTCARRRARSRRRPTWPPTPWTGQPARR